MNILQKKYIFTLIIGMAVWSFDIHALDARTHDTTPATSTGTPTYTNSKQTLLQGIESVMKQYGIVGLSIALVDDQQVVWAEGFGFADKEQQIKATPETVYRAGSISKLFTATAAMQLVERGKLDIDKPLQTYIPEFAIKTRFPYAEPITPRHLMTHHSGLPEAYLKEFRATSPVKPFTQLVDKLTGEYTAYPPNLMLTYSNLAVTLLGVAVENTCLLDFSVCLEQNLLQPLGMIDSEFSQGASVSALMSKEYSQVGLLPATYMRDLPVGGLNSNVLDLSRFMGMVFADGKIEGKSILSPAGLNEMLRQQNADIPLDLDQKIGLAWFFDPTPSGETIAWHNGGIGGFNSHLATIPSQKLGVVVLANTDSAAGVVGDIAISALNLMLSEKSAVSGLSQSSQNPPTKITFNPRTLLGHYASENFGLISIHDNHGSMRINIVGMSYPLALQPDGTAKFTSPNFGGEVKLSRDKLSAHQVLILDSPATGRLLLGEKLAQPHLSKAWSQRVGTYQLTNKGDDVEIPSALYLHIKEGFLILIGGPADLVLTPLNDQEAIIAGLGRGLGQTITFGTHGKQQTLRYMGLVAKSK